MKYLIIVTVFIIMGCQEKQQGVEIASMHFESLIKDELIESLKYQPDGDWLIIDPKETAFQETGFRKSLEKEISEGNIKDKSEFRFILKIASLEYIQKKLQRFEKEFGTEHLDIKILE